MKTALKLMASLLVIFSFTACVHVEVDDEAQNIKIVQAPGPQCQSVRKESLMAASLQILDRPTAKKNLVNRAKNKAADMGADQIKITNEGVEGLGQLAIDVEYFVCQPLAKLSKHSLQVLCDMENGNACAQIAVQSQAAGNYTEMMHYFKMACGAGHKASCEWLTNYARQKEALKKTCGDNDATSCFALAKFADAEGDYELMLKYLNQSCSAGFSESCFYKDYVKEEDRKIYQTREKSYNQYMADLKEETLKQQKIAAAMATLKTIPGK